MLPEEDFSTSDHHLATINPIWILLYTLMLSPKIVALTNHWVWNCPFTDGSSVIATSCLWRQHRENIPRLKELVEKGYSILVFP